MFHSEITIRMRDGEEPQVTITGFEDYRHAERNEMVSASRSLDKPKITDQQADRLKKVLQSILADNAETAEKVAYRGAVIAAAASARAADDAEGDLRVGGELDPEGDAKR